jgi:hypothetical protein
MDRRARAQRELEYIQAEISRLAERIQARELEASKLREFIEVWDQLGSPTDDTGEGAEPETKPAFTEDTSIIDATTSVLRRSTKPLKAREIASRMLAEGFPYEHGEDNLVRSLRGILSRYSRRDVLTNEGQARYWVPRPPKEGQQAELAVTASDEEGEA